MQFYEGKKRERDKKVWDIIYIYMYIYKSCR